MGMRSSRVWMRSSRVKRMRSSQVWMRSSLVQWMRSSLVLMRSSRGGWDLAECGWDLAECGWDLAEWLDRLTVNAKVSTVLGWIPASSDAVESDWRQMEQEQCWIKYIKKSFLCVHSRLLVSLHKPATIFLGNTKTTWPATLFVLFLVYHISCRQDASDLADRRLEEEGRETGAGEEEDRTVDSATYDVEELAEENSQTYDWTSCIS
jgi:hypothetical protein